MLKPLRTERLSRNVLLCLFEGEINKVTIHQRVETLHSGFGGDGGNLVKELRRKKTVAVMLNEKRVVNVVALLSAMGVSNAFPSAEFAVQMIEGVEVVTFLIAGAPG